MDALSVLLSGTVVLCSQDGLETLLESGLVPTIAPTTAPEISKSHSPAIQIVSCSSLLLKLTLVLEPVVTLSSLPLRCVETSFAPDSSGFSTCQFLRWYNQKYGRETDNRKWVKAHVLCGVKTNVVASVLVSEWSANDSPYPTPLLARAGVFRLADKAEPEQLLAALKDSAWE